MVLDAFGNGVVYSIWINVPNLRVRPFMHIFIPYRHRIGFISIKVLFPIVALIIFSLLFGVYVGRYHNIWAVG